MAQDPRHFLFSSDYPMPVLVWEYKNGVIAGVGSYQNRSVTINHGLGFTPLLIGVWSTNSNFNPSFDICNYIGTGAFNQDIQLNACCADNTSVFVEAFNLSTGVKDLYFRLMAYAPPDWTGNTPKVGDTTHFELSTDYNYPKIVKSGVVDITSGQTQDIEHNLGYIPQVKVWGVDLVYDPKITPMHRVVAQVGSFGPIVDSTKLSITANSTGKYYYHIYGDES